MKIFACPSYNQHKTVLATPSVLNEYWLISLLRDRKLKSLATGSIFSGTKAFGTMGGREGSWMETTQIPEAIILMRH